MTKKIMLVLTGLLIAVFSFAQQPGNCLNFDGVDDYVITGDNDDGITAVTIETWVYHQADELDFICGKGLEGLEIHTNSGGVIRFIPRIGAFYDTPTGVLPLNEWTHIACVYDPTNLTTAKIYINGQEVTVTQSGASPNQSLIDNVTAFEIGRRTNNSFYFNGSLDEFRIWNYARTSEQIADSYTLALAPASQTGLISYYNFNQGTAGGDNSSTQTTLIDLTGNFQGTLTNFTLDGSISNFVASTAEFSEDLTAGTLTFTTADLGTQTRTATANVYDLGDIASTDMLQSLYIEVLDDNINTASVDVYYEGNVFGQMIYTGSNDLWAFSPSSTYNWLVGLNTLTTQFVDLTGNTLDVTVNFTYVQVPEAGTLTFTTADLGTQTRTATANVYDLGDIASTDMLQSLYIEVLDDNINTASVDVYYEGNVFGQMIYTGSNDLWAFSPSSTYNWLVGLNTLTTQFVDLNGNTLDVTVNFTYVQMYSVEFSVVNSNGTLTASDGTNNLTSPASIEAGTNITFTTAPDANYEVQEWKLNGNVVAGNTTNTFVINSISENVTVSVEFQSTVGVNDISNNETKFYPNPVVNVLYFNKNIDFEIFDIHGKVLISGKNANSCDLSGFENGIYILKTDNIVQKIVKK